jgi:hypothetical protein
MVQHINLQEVRFTINCSVEKVLNMTKNICYNHTIESGEEHVTALAYEDSFIKMKL